MFRPVVAAGAGVLIALAVTSAAAAGSQGTPLIEAVKGGDRSIVRTLMQRGANVNAAEADGTTVLHWAAHIGDVQTVNALIHAGAGVNTTNRYGVAPLWLAVTNGHADVVDALLRAGADAKATRADSGETVLMLAAMTGGVPVLRRLLASGADPNAVDGNRKQTALMWAAAERHKDAARVLVEAGAQLEAKSSSGLTPLMFAIRAGDIEGTMGLLDLGAQLTANSPEGTTSLGLAMINAHWELAAKLLDRGADPNGSDLRGRPLHMLAFMRRADNRGLSSSIPRMETGNISSLDLANALLAHGARINERMDAKSRQSNMALGNSMGASFAGGTPLYIAAWNCDVEFIRFLLAHGADPSIATSPKIVTPLLAAAGVGYSAGATSVTPQEALETVKLLASLGADVNAVASVGAAVYTGISGGGWNGAGALHGAVIRGATELVTWLVEHGVTLDRKSDTGYTALDLAHGSSLGNNYQTWPDIADILEKAMRAKGMAIRENKYTGDNPIVGDNALTDEPAR